MQPQALNGPLIQKYLDFKGGSGGEALLTELPVGKLGKDWNRLPSRYHCHHSPQRPTPRKGPEDWVCQHPLGVPDVGLLRALGSPAGPGGSAEGTAT